MRATSPPFGFLWPPCGKKLRKREGRSISRPMWAWGIRWSGWKDNAIGGGKIAAVKLECYNTLLAATGRSS